MHDSINGPSAAGRGSTVIAGEPRVRDLHTEPGAAADVQGTWGEVLNGRADVDSPRRPWPGECSGRSAHDTWRGSAMSSSPAPATRRSWLPDTSPRKQPASKVLMAPLLRLKWQCR